MLPFEVPPTFSNRGFYRFLRENEIEIVGQEVRWNCKTESLDPAIFLLFGVEAGTPVECRVVTEWGKTKFRRSVSLRKCELITIPFNFRIAHGIEGRTLSVVHPRNQVSVASFYARYNATIIYYTSLSEFSIRRPVSVSRFTYFRDSLHEEVVDRRKRGIEMENREYEELGSYFVYRRYRNIHRFFESFKYHRCEKKYNAMMQIDINKCFDSIYTHSLPWSVLGKYQAKFDLEESKQTFAGKFDSLMQQLNHNETNGIVIGPEFSRVFAEIILQSIDVELIRHLKDHKGLIHKKDYEIFRYVDDYFVFYNEESTQNLILDALQAALKEKKLSINSAKVKFYKKPLITEITVAKARISELLDNEIAPKLAEAAPADSNDTQNSPLSCVVRSNRLIIAYKTIIKESDVEYGNLLNFTFHITEYKLDKLLKVYKSCSKTLKDQKHLINALLGIMEFSFFAYSASPKVNHTIRVCRMIATTTQFLHSNRIPRELKHLLFKYVHDNILQVLDKNTTDPLHEVESLYLLVALGQIGREYWLPELTLARLLGIRIDQSNKPYGRDDFMNHFSIIVFLSYAKKKARYAALRAFVENHAIAKLAYMKKHCPIHAEAIMLMLDLVACPYLSSQTKLAAGEVFDLDAQSLAALEGINHHWFTAWGDEFDLGKELDAKRSREVY